MDRSVFLAAGAALQTLREILHEPWLQLQVYPSASPLLRFPQSQSPYRSGATSANLPLYTRGDMPFRVLAWATLHPGGQEAAWAAWDAINAACMVAGDALVAVSEQTTPRGVFVLHAGPDGILWGPLVHRDGRNTPIISPRDVAVVDRDAWRLHHTLIPSARVSSATRRFSRVVQPRLKMDLQRLAQGLAPMITHTAQLSLDLAQNRQACPWMPPHSLLEQVVRAHVVAAEHSEIARHTRSTWGEFVSRTPLLLHLCVFRSADAVVVWLHYPVLTPNYNSAFLADASLILRLCAPLEHLEDTCFL